MTLDLLGHLDTYIYAIAVLVFWNFIWTLKLRHKVFGDGKDPTEKGIAKELEELKEKYE